MSKYVKISKSKYRVALSEILPYERPLFYSNRYFARFLKHYGIICQDGRLCATKNEAEGLNDFLRLLSGTGSKGRPAFQYVISKNGNEPGRSLTVIHPYHQVQMIGFYDKFDALMLEFCNRSHFSIRYPSKVASCRDLREEIRKENPYLDETSKNESLKHYFSYEKYSNINEFYDDYRFLRAEKNFRFLRKLDIQECFESIKPESLSKATLKVESNKAVGSMPFIFAEMQKQFGLERGIAIGPEFSRIFAEMILQHADERLERMLASSGILRNEDYKIFRYVDDFFIFGNDKDVLRKATQYLESILKDFEMKLKSEKTLDFNNRPFLEGISIVKVELSQLVDNVFENRLETFKGFKNRQSGNIDSPVYLQFKNFIKDIRTIVKKSRNLDASLPESAIPKRHENETDIPDRSFGDDKNGEADKVGKKESIASIEYKDVMSFLLSSIHSHVKRLLDNFNDLFLQYEEAYVYQIISDEGIKIRENYLREFFDFSKALVETLFFLFGNDSRMSTSIKIVSIINDLQVYVRGRFVFRDGTKSDKFPRKSIEDLDEAITSFTTQAINSVRQTTLLEVLNLLELQKIMSPKNMVKPKVLHKLATSDICKEENLNFFTVFEMLHAIKDYEPYEETRQLLYAWVKEKLTGLANPEMSDTETLLILLEMLSTPYLNKESKMSYISPFTHLNHKSLLSFVEKNHDLFVNWRNYNVSTAIAMACSSEVY